jgi:hypothetical protein
MLLTKTGELWGVGRNEDGKLGLGDTRERETWTKVDIEGVQKVVCGGHFTMPLKENGELWGWGWGDRFIFGTPDSDDVLRPRLVMDHVVDLACGWSHTLVKKTDGTIWGWGDDSNGKLKHGSRPILFLEGKEVASFGCVMEGSWILTDDGILQLFSDELSGPGETKFRLPTNVMLAWNLSQWLFLGRENNVSKFYGLPKEVIFEFIKVVYYMK